MPYKNLWKDLEVPEKIQNYRVYNAIALFAITDAIWFPATSWFSFRPLILTTQYNS